MRTTTRRLAAGIAGCVLAWTPATAQAPAPESKPLSPQQIRLVELLAYVQVVRRHCGYVVDLDLLRLVARQENLNFQDPAAVKAAQNGLADAELKFAGLKRGVECLSALEEYGPRGTVFKGLVEKPPGG